MIEIKDWVYAGVILTVEADTLQGYDFSNMKLQTADFRGANLGFANFAGADLRTADFTGANLWWTDFTGADLIACDFSGKDTDVEWADFTGANLYGANLEDTQVNMYSKELIAEILRQGATLNGHISLMEYYKKSGSVALQKALKGPHHDWLIETLQGHMDHVQGQIEAHANGIDTRHYPLGHAGRVLKPNKE